MVSVLLAKIILRFKQRAGPLRQVGCPTRTSVAQRKQIEGECRVRVEAIHREEARPYRDSCRRMLKSLRKMRFFDKAALFSRRDADNMTAISVGIQRPRRFIKRFARLGVVCTAWC